MLSSLGWCSCCWRYCDLGAMGHAVWVLVLVPFLAVLGRCCQTLVMVGAFLRDWRGAHVCENDGRTRQGGADAFAALGAVWGRKPLDQFPTLFNPATGRNFKHLCCPHKWSNKNTQGFCSYNSTPRSLSILHRSVPEFDMIWPTSSMQSSTCFMLYGVFAGVI